MISLTDFFDTASRHHNDVILLSAIRRVSGNDFVFQQDSVPHTASRTCNSWTAASTNAELSCAQPVASNNPDLSPVDYEIWAVMQHRVYQRQIHSVDELKRRLIDVWRGLEQSILTNGEKDIKRVSTLKRRAFRVQPVNWQCLFCPYLIHSMWLVWLLHV